MARHGKLGVDYYALAFGLMGIVAIPLFFYAVKSFRTHSYKPYYQKLGEITDWEYAEIDIDDVPRLLINLGLEADQLQ